MIATDDPDSEGLHHDQILNAAEALLTLSSRLAWWERQVSWSSFRGLLWQNDRASRDGIRYMKHIVFERGETIFQQGDPSDLAFVILAGSVDIVVSGSDRQERRIASLGPGEVFGEMGIIDPAPRSATAVAREQTACEAYTAEEAIDLMCNDPAKAVTLMRSLIIRLRSSNRKLAAKAAPGPPKPAI